MLFIYLNNIFDISSQHIIINVLYKIGNKQEYNSKILKMKVREDLRKELKEWLPVNYGETIAAKCRRSKSHVYKVMEGKSEDNNVLSELLKLAEKGREADLKLQNKSNALINQ